MNIQEFVRKFKNYPIMFIGTGLSMRYLSVSYSWENLLKKVAYELEPNEEYFLDVKSECMSSNGCDYSKMATRIERDFNTRLQSNRKGKFKYINDAFYECMKNGVNISRFKLYIAELLKNISFKEGTEDEIAELKKARKN